MKLEYDKDANNYWYVIFSMYVSLLLSITCCCLCCNTEEKEAEPYRIYRVSSDSHDDPDPERLLHNNKANRNRQTRMNMIGLVVAWIVLGLLAYHISSFETDHEDYDPFAVLNVDRDASIHEIKQIYRQLSKVHHPDRGGDPQIFKEIAKAHQTLTDEGARENWRKYGNPDGPKMLRFGYGVPNYFFDSENSVAALSILIVTLFIVLPMAMVCLCSIFF